jgi:hypothetical protein
MTSTVSRRVVAIALVCVMFFFALTHGWKAEALPQGCPPQSSICNPVGMALIGGDVMAGGAAASTAAVSTTATVTTGTVAATAGGAMLATLGGILTGEFIWGEEPPVELTMTDGAPPGWVNGVDTITWTSGELFKTFRFTINQAGTGLPPVWNATDQQVLVVIDLFTNAASGAQMNNISAQSVTIAPRGLEGQPIGGSEFNQNYGNGGLWFPGGVKQEQITFVATLSGLSHIDVVQGELRQYAIGHAEYVEGELLGVGVVTTVIECIDASAVITSFSASLPAVFTPGEPFEHPAVACPADTALYGYGVKWEAEGFPAEWIVPWTITPTWVHDLPIDQPQCLIGNTCELTLSKVGVGGQLDYCGVAAIGCPEWWQHPNKSEAYLCQFGPYEVTLGHCNVFRNPGQLTPNVGTTTDPKNNVKHSAGAQPDLSLDPDLSCSNCEPIPPRPPEPEPIPPIPPIPDDLEPITSTECFPQGWGLFNPFEWVYRPITCAFRWAFIPRADVVTGLLTAGRQAVENTPPFSIVAPLPGALLDVYGGLTAEECGSLPDFDPEQEGRLELPCNPNIDGWASAYGFMRLTIWLSSGWAAWVIVTRGLGNKDHAEG